MGVHGTDSQKVEIRVYLSRKNKAQYSLFRSLKLETIWVGRVGYILLQHKIVNRTETPIFPT